MQYSNQVVAKMCELASSKRRFRHVVDRVSIPRCIAPNRYRFDLFEKGEPIGSVEVVCPFNRLSRIEAEISKVLSSDQAHS